MLDFAIRMIVQTAFGTYFDNEEKFRLLREGYGGVSNSWTKEFVENVGFDQILSW